MLQWQNWAGTSGTRSEGETKTVGATTRSDTSSVVLEPVTQFFKPVNCAVWVANIVVLAGVDNQPRVDALFSH